MLRDEQAERDREGKEVLSDTIARECPVSEWKETCHGVPTGVLSCVASRPGLDYGSGAGVGGSIWVHMGVCVLEPKLTLRWTAEQSGDANNN